MMDCIPYINDLQIEIQILKDVRASGNCDIESVNEKIQEKEILIDNCKNNLSKLSNNQIEYRIYLKLLNGINPSRAIEMISLENSNADIRPTNLSVLWKKYQNLKKITKA